MISKTKTDLSTQEITALCAAAGYKNIENVHPLGAGEFNAVYAFDANGQAYALKVAPGADVPVMTYEQNMMQTEVFWYKQLQSQTDIAVPEIAYTDFSPFAAFFRLFHHAAYPG